MSKAKGEAPLGALIVRVAHGDREAARQIVGARSVKTLREVAAFFGVQETTVKTSWRRTGEMPGRAGAWPLAEIVVWKLGRDTTPEASAAGDGAALSALDRKREADARKAEADAEKKEVANRLARRELVYRDDVDRVLAEAVATARHILLQIPRKLLPLLPRTQRHQLSEQIAGRIAAALNRVADEVPQALDAATDIS